MERDGSPPDAGGRFCAHQLGGHDQPQLDGSKVVLGGIAGMQPLLKDPRRGRVQLQDFGWTSDMQRHQGTAPRAARPIGRQLAAMIATVGVDRSTCSATYVMRLEVVCIYGTCQNAMRCNGLDTIRCRGSCQVDHLCPTMQPLDASSPRVSTYAQSLASCT